MVLKFSLVAGSIAGLLGFNGDASAFGGRLLHRRGDNCTTIQDCQPAVCTAQGQAPAPPGFKWVYKKETVSTTTYVPVRGSDGVIKYEARMETKEVQVPKLVPDVGSDPEFKAISDRVGELRKALGVVPAEGTNDIDQIKRDLEAIKRQLNLQK